MRQYLRSQKIFSEHDDVKLGITYDFEKCMKLINDVCEKQNMVKIHVGNE
jgi:hypothetical protein